jgi:lysophospholipase L1-like esterase
MRIRSLVFAGLLAALLALMGVAAVARFQRSYEWWDALAIALAAVCALLVVAGALRRGRRAERAPSPRWFELRANVVGLCALPVLALWWGFRVPAGMGSGPAGPAVDVSRFAKPWRQEPVQFVALGDSVSTGYGAGTGLGYFDLIIKNHDGVYPEMRGAELSRALPEFSVMRLAANSTNSLEHERVIEAMAEADRDVFGVICITTGGIDLIHPYGRGTPKEGAMFGATYDAAKPWIERFETRLDRMMRALKAKFPGGCAVFIATIYDPTDGEEDIENAGPIFWLGPWPEGMKIFEGFNAAIARIAEKHEHVHLVDVHKVMLGHGIHCRDRDNPHYHPDDPTYWYYVNLEDPNQRGYDAIRRAFLNAIADALEPR